MTVSDVSSTQNNSYIEILKSFNRNTTINDVQGLMAKSLFMLYDLKDEISGKRDGKFDDREWNLFEQFRNTILSNEQKNSKNKVNKSAVKYYKKQVEKLEKTVEELEKQYKEKFEIDYFKEWNDYEVSHNLVFHGLKEGEESPENTFLLNDIEPFGIGIEQKNKESFEGIYKKAYIEGFDKLTKEEQQEYIEKYQKALKWCKETREFEENVFGKEIDKLQDAIVLYNASQDGILNEDYRSEEKRNEILERYKSENPYLSQIEDTQNQLTKERLKVKPNTAKIVELENLLNGLYLVSDQWRLKFSSQNKQNNQPQKAQLNISGGVAGIHTDEEGEEYFVTSPNINVGYGNEKAGVNVNGSIDNKYPASNNVQDKSTQTAYKAGISSHYNSAKFGVNQNSTFVINPNYKMQNHELRLRYLKTSIGISENIRRMNMQSFNPETNQPEQTTRTSYVTNVNLSQQIDSTNIGGSVQFAEEGITYSANAGYNCSTRTKNLNLSLEPSASFSYTKTSDTNSVENFNIPENEQFGMSNDEGGFQQGDVCSLNAGLNANIEYNHRNFNAGLNISDYIGTQFPRVNNTFNAIASAKYKDFGFKISDMNRYSQERKSNTITAGINYSGKYGEVETSFSHTRTSMPMMNELGEMTSNITHGNKFTVSVKLFIDKLFSSKK